MNGNPATRPTLNPYVLLGIKSFVAFMLALGGTAFLHKVSGQISLYDWLALLWPGFMGVAYYWTGIADATPAPWITPAQAYASADKLAASTTPSPLTPGGPTP